MSGFTRRSIIKRIIVRSRGEGSLTEASIAAQMPTTYASAYCLGDGVLSFLNRVVSKEAYRKGAPERALSDTLKGLSNGVVYLTAQAIDSARPYSACFQRSFVR